MTLIRTFRQRADCPTFVAFFLAVCVAAPSMAQTFDVAAIETASGAKATETTDGVIRIGWSRTDVKIVVDGMPFHPAAGLGSWAAFKKTDRGAMAMGDTVVFQDEVDAAMDAAFAGGLEVTALHNHFFFDEPKAYFIHIGGYGDPTALAKGVRAVWDAIKIVRAESPQPTMRFGGPIPKPGALDAAAIERITGLKPRVNEGVVKISVGREATMRGETIGGSMGLTSWAAFSGDDALAAMDGDIIMRDDEVQSVLRSLRDSDVHIVALHNHMIGETPSYYFTHFWGVGRADELATAFRLALNQLDSDAR